LKAHADWHHYLSTTFNLSIKPLLCSWGSVGLCPKRALISLFTVYILHSMYKLLSVITTYQTESKSYDSYLYSFLYSLLTIIYRRYLTAIGLCCNISRYHVPDWEYLTTIEDALPARREWLQWQQRHVFARACTCTPNFTFSWIHNRRAGKGGRWTLAHSTHHQTNQLEFFSEVHVTPLTTETRQKRKVNKYKEVLKISVLLEGFDHEWTVNYLVMLSQVTWV
jgi:hypothetical protein